jgi:hypothetical protein
MIPGILDQDLEQYIPAQGTPYQQGIGGGGGGGDIFGNMPSFNFAAPKQIGLSNWENSGLANLMRAFGQGGQPYMGEMDQASQFYQGVLSGNMAPGSAYAQKYLDAIQKQMGGAKDQASADMSRQFSQGGMFTSGAAGVGQEGLAQDFLNKMAEVTSGTNMQMAQQEAQAKMGAAGALSGLGAQRQQMEALPIQMLMQYGALPRQLAQQGANARASAQNASQSAQNSNYWQSMNFMRSLMGIPQFEIQNTTPTTVQETSPWGPLMGGLSGLLGGMDWGKMFGGGGGAGAGGAGAGASAAGRR